MKRTRAMNTQSLDMLGRPISLVPVEPVMRIFEMIVTHHSVPVDLGHDGRCGNGQTPRVTAGNPFMGYVQRQAVRAVDEEKVREESKVLHRQDHGPKGGLEDIDPVDFGGFYTACSHIQGAFEDLPAAAFAPGSIEFFRIPDPGQYGIFGQNDCSGHYRAGQRTPPDFVDPGH